MPSTRRGNLGIVVALKALLLKMTQPGSTFVVALCCFLSINWLLGWKDTISPYTNYRKSELASQLRHLEKLKLQQAPTLLIGSSVLRNPLRVCENKQLVDGSIIETRCGQSGFAQPVLVVAAEGLMISDSSIITRWIERNVGKPKRIVLFVYLGSFIERESEHVTHAVRLCMTAYDYLTMDDFYVGGLSTRLTGLASSILPMYGSRQSVQKALLTKLGSKDFQPLGPEENVRRYLLDREKLSINRLSKQITILDNFLHEAHSKGIETCVVNMPCRSDSRDINNLTYDQYIQDLRRICQAQRSQLVDLQATGNFEYSDFGDWHHITTQKGSAKFFEKLIGILDPKGSGLTKDPSTAPPIAAP